MNVPPAPFPAAESAPPMPVCRRGWWIHLALIVSYPLLIGVLGMGGSNARGPALTGDAKGLLSVCVIQLLIFGVVFGGAWLASRASRNDLLLQWRGGFWPVPMGIGYSVAIRVALGLIVVAVAFVLILLRIVTLQALEQFSLANRPDVEAIVDVSALRENPLYFWLTLTLVSFVLGGLREELWRSAFLAGMKALWPQRFGSRSGQITAVTVAAVIFGFGHVAQGGLAVCMTGLIGFMLGVIIVLHRSIWPAVIAHGMFDATSLALFPWAMEKLQQIQPALGH